MCSPNQIIIAYFGGAFLILAPMVPLVAALARRAFSVHRLMRHGTIHVRNPKTGRIGKAVKL